MLPTINDNVNALAELANANLLNKQDIQIIEDEILEIEYPEIYHLPIPERSEPIDQKDLLTKVA